MKKKIKITIISVVLVFIIYNLIWYFGSFKVYHDLQKSFPEIQQSGVKVYVDDDKFQYSVAVPGYLSWDGNLAVSEEHMKYSLLIWLKPFGTNAREGVMLNDEAGISTQIDLKNSTTASRQADQKMVHSNEKRIAQLYNKANKVWNLELK